METPTLLNDSLELVDGCACPGCCARPMGPTAEDAQFDAQSYEQFSLMNFAAAVAAVADPAPTLAPAALVEENRGISVLEEPLPPAALQGSSAIAFSDVSRQSGLNLVTQTWGSAWGDVDGDGFLDKWLNRHQLPPILYRNQGDGTFVEVTDAVFLSADNVSGDFHGAAFVDIDNNGTQDLIQLAGGDQGASDDNPNKEKKLYINENGQLRNRSAELGVDYLIGRGRVPVPFDLNNDGLLDYVFSGPARSDGTAPPTIFLQNNDGTFADVGTQADLNIDVPSGTFGMVSDLNGDGRMELLYAANSPRLTVYDTETFPLNDITDQLLPPMGNTNIQDVAIGDFNGDGRQDIFTVSAGSASSGVRFDGDDILASQSGRVRLLVPKAMERGVEVVTGGSVSLNFKGDPRLDLPQFMQGVGITPEQISIGSRGYHPDDLVFSLDALDVNGNELGMPTYTPGVDQGVFIGYENDRWKIMLSDERYDEVSFLYEFSEPIDDFLAVNFNPFPDRNPSRLLINTENGFVDESRAAGLRDLDVSAANVASGDFDNDGDLDLYIVATDMTKNQPNILLDNQGDGTFVQIADAAGASGTALGLGDGVAVADYDNDGDLDLFVTNGDVAGFRRPFLMDGANQLFRNDLNNGNHWVLIDLEGVASNRDGIGARVEVTAGGKTQVREQNGGIHNRSQNDKRLHFGLGRTDSISRIEIFWPSGERDVINNVAADQILTIVEGSGEVTGGGNNNNPPPPTGNQIIEGTSAGDVLVGGAARDVIRGRAGADQILGLSGNDNLFGDSGRDVIDGGAGNDLIVGGQGNDRLTGGAGQDKFLFNTTRDRADIITDFNVNQDMIRFRASKFGGGLEVGTLRDGQFHIGSGARQASHRVIYNDQTGQLFFDQDGNGGSSAILIATLQGLPNLSASNIRLV